LLGIFFCPEDGGDMFLHSVISQKIELFITTAGRTANPTIKVFVHTTYVGSEVASAVTAM
jgi:hypothetical protein